LVEDGDIAGDDAGAFEAANPPQAGRRRQRDAHGQVGETDPAVLLQNGKDAPVDVVHCFFPQESAPIPQLTARICCFYPEF